MLRDLVGEKLPKLASHLRQLEASIHFLNLTFFFISFYSYQELGFPIRFQEMRVFVSILILKNFHLFNFPPKASNSSGRSVVVLLVLVPNVFRGHLAAPDLPQHFRRFSLRGK